MKSHLRRRAENKIMTGLMFLFAILTIIPLISIFAFVITKGVTSINLDFFTHLPKPVGEPGGGMANAIVGTLLLVSLACLWAIPVGILAGVYMVEFAGPRIASTIRFTADVLSGIPSIVIGVFAYSLMVLPMRSFSTISGAFALGFMLIPTVLRTTEEMIKLVPQTLREGALALGISRFKTTIHIVLSTTLPGIITGTLLGVARIAGETAPLLFTAFGNRVWSTNLFEPIAALPLQIFVYAISPFEDWQRQAWAGALVLIMMVFVLSVVSRSATKRKYSFS